MVYTSARNAILTAAYVFLVSLIFQYGEKVFGKMDNLIGPAAFLMIFVLSAALTGTLILGKPVLMYLDGKKKEAVKLFGLTILFLTIITVVIFIINLILK